MGFYYRQYFPQAASDSWCAPSNSREPLDQT